MHGAGGGRGEVENKGEPVCDVIIVVGKLLCPALSSRYLLNHLAFYNQTCWTLYSFYSYHF